MEICECHNTEEKKQKKKRNNDLQGLIRSQLADNKLETEEKDGANVPKVWRDQPAAVRKAVREGIQKQYNKPDYEVHKIVEKVVQRRRSTMFRDAREARGTFSEKRKVFLDGLAAVKEEKKSRMDEATAAGAALQKETDPPDPKHQAKGKKSSKKQTDDNKSEDSAGRSGLRPRPSPKLNKIGPGLAGTGYNPEKMKNLKIDLGFKSRRK